MNKNKAKNSILIKIFYNILITLIIFITIFSYIPIGSVIAATENSQTTNNGNNVNGSQLIIEKAIECHKYLRERRFTYGYSGTGIPGFLNDGQNLVDCSLYVGWVLYEAGYDPYVAYESDYYSNDHGFTIVPNDQVQPGDILNLTGRHVEIAAAVENGEVTLVYNCGYTGAIQAEGSSEYPETVVPSNNNYDVIIRAPGSAGGNPNGSLLGSSASESDEDGKIPALVPYLVNSVISKYAQTPIIGGGKNTNYSGGMITNYAESGDGWSSVTEVKYPNGVTRKYRNYKQGMGSYSGNHYWDGTIASDACGPSSIAIILSGYGYDVDPGGVVDIMHNEFGTDASDSFEKLRQPLKYVSGIEAEDHWSTGSSEDVSRIRESFANARPVVVNAPGHYIVLLGEDTNGKLIVSDPANKFYHSEGGQGWAFQGPDTLEQFVSQGMITCGYIVPTSDGNSSSTTSSSNSKSNTKTNSTSNNSTNSTINNNPQGTGEATMEACPAENGGYDTIFTSGTTGRQFKEFRQNLDGWNEKYPITQYPGVWPSGWRSECGTVSTMTIGSGYSADASFEDVINKLEAANGYSSLDGWIQDYTGQNLNWSYSYSKDEIANKLSSGCVALLHSTSSLVSSSGTHYMSILDIKSDKSQVYLSNPWQGSNYQGWITFDQLSAIFESIAFVTNDGSAVNYSGSIKKNIAEDKIFYIGDSWMEGLRDSGIAKSPSSYFYAESSRNADWVLDTYSSMKIPSDASCIVVEFGLNDTDKWTETQKLVDKLINDYPNKDVVVLQTPHVCEQYDYFNIKGSDLNKNIDNYNKKMKEYCSSKNGATFIDPTTNIVENNGSGFLKTEYSNSTYFHLNNNGYKVWYDDIVKGIKDTLTVSETAGSASGSKQYSNPTFSKYIVPNDHNGYKLDIDLDAEVEWIIKKLKKKDFNMNDYLSTSEQKEYLKNILKACIVVQYPDLRAADEIAQNKGTDELQGCIRVKRYADDDTLGFSGGLSNIKDEEDDGTYLSYIPYDQLSGLVSNSDQNALNYFSLDRNNNIVYAGWETLNVSVDIKQIGGEPDPNPDPAPAPRTEPYSKLTLKTANYLNQITNYSVPFSLFWSLLVYSGDEDFVNDFAKLVIDTDIVIGCYDATTTKETVYTNQYDKHDVEEKSVWVDNKNVGTTTVENTYTYEVTEKQLLKTDNPTIKIKHADTWTAVYNMDYETTYKETTDNSETELEDETSHKHMGQVTENEEINEEINKNKEVKKISDSEKNKLKEEAHKYNQENFKERYNILNDFIDNVYKFSGKYVELLKIEDVQNYIINMIIDENSNNYIKNQFVKDNEIIIEYADEIGGEDIRTQAADAVITMVEKAKENNSSKGSIWDRLTNKGNDTRKNKKIDYDISAISFNNYEVKENQTEKVDTNTKTPEIQEKTSSEKENVIFKTNPIAKGNSFVKLLYYSKHARDNLDLIMDWFFDSLENTAAIADLEDLLKYLFQCVYHVDLGIDEDRIKELKNFFDPKKMGRNMNRVSGTSTLQSADIEGIYNYFIGHGFTSAGAAGVMGNMEDESNFIPDSVESWYLYDNAEEYKREYTRKVDSGEISKDDFIYNGPDGNGYGLVGFTWWEIKKELYENTVEKGRSIADMEGQLECIIKWVKERIPNLYTTLTTSNDLYTCTYEFLTEYERPAYPNPEHRYNNAQKYYK